MKRNPSLITGIVASAGMIALILDSKTALSGAVEGIELCIRTVVPALFPFFLLSSLLTGSFSGRCIPFLRPIGRLCGMPSGSETILLTGLLGGYPVGARCVCQAYADGHLTRADARRMLGFCSNAGPAFLFGMTGFLFQNKAAPLALWLIHIVSSLMTGAILPGRASVQVNGFQKPHRPSVQVLQESLRAIGCVCGWVVIFRIILAFGNRWFLWMLPRTVQTFITGILELTNGYMDLPAIESESARFVLASVFLAFGGICVAMQTGSVAAQAGLDLKYYFTGKLIQTAISAILALFLSGQRFTDGFRIEPAVLLSLVVITAGGILLLQNKKNSSSIPGASGV